MAWHNNIHMCKNGNNRSLGLQYGVYTCCRQWKMSVSKFLGWGKERCVLSYVKKIGVNVRKEGVGFHNNMDIECANSWFSGISVWVVSWSFVQQIQPEETSLFNNSHPQNSRLTILFTFMITLTHYPTSLWLIFATTIQITVLWTSSMA